MTATQRNLITKYKVLFPKDTFKEISLKTNIQQTRVFRIFNGAEMKLKEYESISNVLKATSNFSIFEFREVTLKCENELSSEQLNEFMSEMNYLLEIKGSVQC